MKTDGGKNASAFFIIFVLTLLCLARSADQVWAASVTTKVSYKHVGASSSSLLSMRTSVDALRFALQKAIRISKITVLKIVVAGYIRGSKVRLRRENLVRKALSKLWKQDSA